MRLIVRKVAIAMGITKPVRGTSQTNHSDAAAKLILNGTLLSDDLAQVFEFTLIGRDAATKAIVLGFILPFMVVRRSAESPNAYSVVSGTEQWMNAKDTDLEPEVIAVGDTNYQINMFDTSGDLGIVDWEHSLQLKESISLA